jgi:hypothetical protein
MGATLQEGLDDAGEGGQGISPWLGLGTLGDLLGDHRWPQHPLHSVVRWLHFRLLQETQQVSPLAVAAQHPQQFLVVLVLEKSVS